VCYDRGNTEPTVTDANVVMQTLNPTHLLGGRMKVRQDLARAAIQKVADKLGALDIATLLIAHGANVNAQLITSAIQKSHTPGEPTLGTGTTALMRAAKNGDHTAIRVLLAHGADASIVQKNRTTSLMFAAGLGRGESHLGLCGCGRGEEERAPRPHRLSRTKV
jgi:N-methylhydantoinase A/oxoprolinase/acetone carboxylase beta subunit